MTMIKELVALYRLMPIAVEGPFRKHGGFDRTAVDLGVAAQKIMRFFNVVTWNELP